MPMPPRAMGLVRLLPSSPMPAMRAMIPSPSSNCPTTSLLGSFRRGSFGRRIGVRKKLMAQMIGTTRNAMRQSTEDKAPPAKVRIRVVTISTAVKRPMAAAIRPGLATDLM